MTWALWLWDRKWYVLFGLLVVVAFFVGAGGPALELLRAQMQVTDEKQKARELKIRHGADNAERAIRARHKETVDDLDARERAKVDRLAGDPVGLSAELTRIGRRRRRARERGAPGEG